MRRILIVAAVVVIGSLASAAPAQAASGPWSVVSAGESQTCAINGGKSLYCWGDTWSGQQASPSQVGTSGAWAAVSAGSSHVCAVTTGNSLYCWGLNGSGQLGDGTFETRTAPKRVGSSGIWAQVSASGQHTCAITTGKSLYCWGDNVAGQIGDGTVELRPSPKRIGTSGAWAAVSGGNVHTCAVSSGKSLYCWGSNLAGQIGDGTDIQRPSPKRIGTAGAWTEVDAGAAHTCAITTGNSLYCWGNNEQGAIGDGTSGPDNLQLSPKKIGTSGVWASTDAGLSHTCAVSIAKSLYCWGSNEFGQIGDGSLGGTQESPKRIGTSGAWTGAAAGGFHSCATTTGNALYCWGANYFGQIGDGTTEPRLSPRKVA